MKQAQIPTLYRGDSIPGKASKRVNTFARHFIGTGLLAKFANGGTSDLIEGKSLLQLVLEHVGYVQGAPSERVSRHSTLISFSERRKSGLRFVDRSKKKDLVCCPFYEATHFLWRLSAELALPEEPGLYRLSFKADPINCIEFAEQRIRAATPGNEGHRIAALAELRALENANRDLDVHQLRLVDVMRYVSERESEARGFSSRLYENTLERARRDAEWLVQPFDPMSDGRGLSSRIPMNRHLFVDSCFRIENPAPPGT